MTNKNRSSRFLESVFPNIKEAEVSLKINAFYGSQFGHLVLSPTEFVEMDNAGGLGLEEIFAITNNIVDEEDESVENDEMNVWEEIQKDYLLALSNNPHLFGLSDKDTISVESYSSVYSRFSFTFNKTLSFTIKVPKSKKKFRFDDDGKEQFDVLTTGSSYIAFVELEDCPQRILIGQEYREQMQEFLNSANSTFRLGQVGPSPMHPLIYLIDVSNPEYVESVVKHFDNDIYIIVNLQARNCSAKDIFQDILYSVKFELERFYTLCCTRSLLYDLNWAIQLKLQQTVNSYIKIEKNVFFINYKKIAGIRQDLLIIHKGSLELELQTANYEATRKSFFSTIEDNFLLDGLQKYFIDILENNYSLGNALFKTLEYLEKSISSLDVAVRTIFAAIIGASIGMFIALL